VRQTVDADNVQGCIEPSYARRLLLWTSRRELLKPAKERAMKLNSALVERTLNQFDAQAIPENHPVIHRLNSLFGDHTFFLDTNGLNIVEPTGQSDSGSQTGQVVKIAGWSDDNRNNLAPHDPEPTEVVIVLGQGPDDAA
jgi:hypothetical protein